MSALRVLLKELEDDLKRMDAPVSRRFKQGVESFEFYKAQYPFFPPEVEELYKWKDGVMPSSDDMIGSLCFFRMMFFTDIETAFHIHKVMAADSFVGWKPDKFPLFRSGAGEFLLIDCDEDSPTYRMLLFHSVGSVDFDMIISKYDTVNTLLTSTLECFKEGIYYYEGDLLESDYDLEFEVFKKNNPRSAYWKLF